MDGIFKQPEKQAEKKKTAKKTKAEMDAEEYAKVCEKMKALRDLRKDKLAKKREEKANPPPPKEDNIKVEIREVIKEVPVDREVIKEVIKEVPVEKEVIKEVVREVEKPVEVIKEVVKEVPAKKSFLDEDDDIRSELRSLKKMLGQMVKPEPSKPIDIQKPAPPQKFVFGGIYNGFKPF